MLRGKCRLLPVLALLALAILLFRPIVLDGLGMPFGSHDSASVKLVKAEGSPHCELLADCETVSITNTGLNLGSGVLLVGLAGFVVALAATAARRLPSWAAPVPNPPPLASIG
jgi:hypothetical protein